MHFGYGEQQDSHEFMMKLFDKLHHDLNRHGYKSYQNGYSNGNGNSSNVPIVTIGNRFWAQHKDYNESIISETFEGMSMSILTCRECGGQSSTCEVFNCLSLPILPDQRCHLRDCLKYFTREENIEAAWECPKCNMKRPAKKKIVICKLPKILIIHLKR